ncbi:MAG: hypothetical protein FJZ63_07970, partial [Chlamydiae bacterium]|nr:hypothetical protein [Chlamydiota bacterium]
MISEERNKNSSEQEFSPEEKVLQEFNKRYAIVRTSTTYILVQKTEDTFELDSRKSFIHFHENDFFLSHEGQLKNKALFWLKHARRRTYENLVFNPARPGCYGDSYNIFKGFAVIPGPGDCSLFWRHVKEVICCSREEHYIYVRKWMASIVQKPTLLATALVLRGLQGTGKNKFVDYFGKIFGIYFLTVTSLEHICGKFNSHLKYAYLIHANEAIWGGSKKEVGAIKALITDAKIVIEGKGKDAIPVDNCRHLIVSSNEEWAVPMDLDDRRFFVLDVAAHRKGDLEYFRLLDQEMQAEGLQALLYDLLHEDLSQFDPRQMPLNDCGFDIKMRSAGSIENYIYHALKEESFSAGADWGSCPCETLYGYYRDLCRKEALRQEPSSEFGKKLKKLVTVQKTRRSMEGVREWWYELPPLQEA